MTKLQFGDLVHLAASVICLNLNLITDLSLASLEYYLDIYVQASQMAQLHCKISVRNHRKSRQPRCHAFWCKLAFTLILKQHISIIRVFGHCIATWYATLILKQLEANIHPVIMLTYFYYTAIRPFYRHKVCNAPVSCKANGVRNKLWAWLDSDPKALVVVFLQINQIEQNIGFKAIKRYT